MPFAEIVIEIGGERALDHGANRAGFVLFAAFLLSFAFIRMSARLMRSPKVPWWPGSVTTGDLHIHHLVFGIVLLLVAGFASIAFQPDSPWLEATAAVFGIGAGLTLDEFALWLHLDDVYWSDEGRQSVDAVLFAALLGGLVLTGTVPFGDGGGVVGIVTTGLLVIALSALALLKGKYVLGAAGLLFPLLSLTGAIRLAKPGTPWARWRYPEGSRKLARAQQRADHHAARLERWQDRIGGAPDKPSPRKPPP
ncbi:hypothetical protein [Conexibacter woesei]|uniref:Integral membrane protein n=1 Tax=Conexibacter woesei (strain DSM 14684 / CCUG 47730 / CIP 108061 / JCM 11494 / NBRC 100937 / ID131577) TaxID=469383 RepID=D3F3Z5_CONWI|nr:hypothetical protein [Conexibacter woesei]ADB48478.1 hypothetical protein Cwoe_0042 [Conexibacter woesei DSM 14684]